MASSTLNQYDGTWGQNDRASVVAADMETAARVLAANRGSDPQLLQRVKEGIQVEMPVLDVAFYGEVSDQAAQVAGCQVFPRRFVVPGGTQQIFSCLLVPGWQITGWQIDGQTVMESDGVTPVSSPVALLTIPVSPVPIKVTAIVAST